MPTSTYTPLANLTLSADAASVTFSSIASGIYRDLVLISSIKNVSSSQYARMRLNGDTGSNYNALSVYSEGTTYFDESHFYMRIQGYTPINSFMTTITNFFDYASTDKHKSILMRTADMEVGDVGTEMNAYRWKSTSAISSIVISSTSGNLASGSSFALYGIVA